ncbi:histidine phosphatase family protein [Nocardioides sp. C4-1]|uniref:histidine phosphatase family protein n=1 Tax=Nocardioides sp. C4-1 TaxID=3151851 RepID=UPI00326502D5
MTRTLVLLRHGRTAFNHERRLQGQLDVGLDDVGRAQAEAVAPAVAALSPAVVWSSDLERTRQTVAPVAAACGLEVTFDARLREFGFGPYEGLTHDDLADRDPDSLAALRRGDYEQVTHAEPTGVVHERMLAALHDLLAATEPGQTAVAVSHGAAIRVAVGALLAWPDGVFRTLGALGNCHWAALHEHSADGVLRLQAYGRSVG